MTARFSASGGRDVGQQISGGDAWSPASGVDGGGEQ
jgi:hypothetical protein